MAKETMGNCKNDKNSSQLQYVFHDDPGNLMVARILITNYQR